MESKRYSRAVVAERVAEISDAVELIQEQQRSNRREEWLQQADELRRLQEFDWEERVRIRASTMVEIAEEDGDPVEVEFLYVYAEYLAREAERMIVEHYARYGHEILCPFRKESSVEIVREFLRTLGPVRP